MDQSLSSLLMHIVSTFSGMVWQIYWPLAFGLILSSLLRHMLPVDKVAQHLGQTSPRSLMLTTLLGMLSSSCSYAAASLSKTLITKKASLSNAMAFLVASTNLILEMFIVLVTLLGWQFLWGEIAGGILLIILVAILFNYFPKTVETELRNKIAADASPMLKAHEHEHEHEHMHMEHESVTTSNEQQPQVEPHNAQMQSGMAMNNTQQPMSDADKMDVQQQAASSQPTEMKCGMSDSGEMRCSMNMDAPATKETLADKISRSSGYFQMDIDMIGKEILIGVVISSLLIALIPADWWRDLFITSGSTMPAMAHSVLDVLIGIGVAVIAYVCSVGNLLLAAALWHGGISFGGVMGFILADVLTIPMTRVYRNYYGKQPTRWMVGLLFIGILLTGILLDLTLGQMDWSASKETLRTLHHSGIGFNVTTIMNLIFMPLSVWYYRLGKKTNAASGMTM